MTPIDNVPRNLVEKTRSEFFGRHKPVLSRSGMLLYQSNDTAAARMELSRKDALAGSGRAILCSTDFPPRTFGCPVAGTDVPPSRFRPPPEARLPGFLFPRRSHRQSLRQCVAVGLRVVLSRHRTRHGPRRRGKGEYAFINNWWHPSGAFVTPSWTGGSPAGTMNDDLLGLITEPVHYHTHHPYYRTRCRRVKNMNVVVVVRSILESLEGNFFKVGNSPLWPEVTLDDEDSFNWNRYLDDDIEFYNSWGDVATWHPRCLIVRYHELKADQVGTLKAMTDFWKLDIPLECLEEALREPAKRPWRKSPEGRARNESPGLVPQGTRRHLGAAKEANPETLAAGVDSRPRIRLLRQPRMGPCVRMNQRPIGGRDDHLARRSFRFGKDDHWPRAS